MGVARGFTAERMLAIEQGTVTSGLVDTNGHLILYKRDNTAIDAGNVVGPVGFGTPQDLADTLASAKTYTDQRNVIVRAETVSYLGTIDPLWTSGLPPVTLDGSSQVVYPLLPFDDTMVEPGGQVLMDRTASGTYYIVSGVRSAPSFTKQINLLPYAATNWGDYEDFKNKVAEETYGRPKATKSSAGWVVLSGLLRKRNSSVVNGELVMTLPVGFRPTRDLLFPIYSTFGSYGVSVKTTGEMNLQAPAGSLPFDFSLANIRFNTSVSWINMTMVSPWSSVSGYTAQYARDIYGVVTTRGRVQGGSHNTNMWSPPAGYAMHTAYGDEAHMSTVHSTSAGFAYVNTSKSGTPAAFKPRVGIPQSIDSILYPSTAATTLVWMFPGSMMNGWVNYNGAMPQAGFCLRPDGLVQLRGLIASGVIGQSMFRLPEGLRPKTRLIFHTPSNDGYGRVDVSPEGFVTPILGSNSWVSLDGIMYAAEK